MSLLDGVGFTKKQVSYLLLGVGFFLVLWVNLVRPYLIDVTSNNLPLALIINIVVGYGIILYFYYRATDSFKKTIGLFIFLFLIISPSIGFDFDYAKDGLEGKVVHEGNRLEVDLQTGLFLEQKLFKCSSLPTSNMSKCSNNQTSIIFHLLNEGFGFIGLLLLLIFFDYRTVRGYFLK